MKKLMFAIAAVTAGVAVADLTSANVVGYQNVTAKNGYTLMTPTFENITNNLTLADIVPVGDDAGYGSELMTVFDKDLGISAEYTYYCADYGMEGGAGWYDEDENNCNSELLGGLGHGVQIYSDGASIRFNGQVAKGNDDGKVVISGLNQGYTFISNPTPTQLDIQDFVPVGGDSGYGSEIITMFDEDLGLDGEYTYYCEDYGMESGAGWYDEDENRVTVDIPAGYGFNIKTEGDCTIEIPSAL